MARRTAILGLNAYHGDSSACLLLDGELVAAAEEERFHRVKHWAGFPAEAARACLAEAGLEPAEIDHVAINRDPSAHLLQKALFALRRRPDVRAVTDRLKNAFRVGGAEHALAEALGAAPGELRADFHRIEHHRAHMASSFFVSPFEEAAVLSVDGFGDFVSTMWGYGHGSRLAVADKVSFPHSLGLFYLAITQLLGFHDYGDEYKVMGLAPYGEPTRLPEMRRIVRLLSGGRFELDLDCFLHASEGVSMVWDGGSPVVGRAFSAELEQRLGPAREPGEELTQEHRDVAASAQAMYEEALFHVLDQLSNEVHFDALCLAGGCAMNSAANGKITERTRFRRLYVPPAPGDAGGAIGAALCIWNQALGRPRTRPLTGAYLGPGFADDAAASDLADAEEAIARAGCHPRRLDDEEELCRLVAERIAEGAVVGWFQGRMEWGPRALGNRSILADPRRADMRDVLNEKIKKRETFRPFAPSILGEAVGEWFVRDGEAPFMAEVRPVRPERRAEIPAVVHVDGTGRLQTVSREDNPLYHRLISAFRELTGVPILLNTSFNENEPVVCRPREAIDCFLRTDMDLLVIGNHVLERRPEPAAPLPAAREGGGARENNEARTRGRA
jgi:carbamoyltransferase